jgi:hypothetical protein
MVKKPPTPPYRVAVPRHKSKGLPSPQNALLRLTGVALKQEHLGAALGEIRNTESDRAAAILAGSFVEDCLQQAISRRLKIRNNHQRSQLFGINAPLGSFANKIRIGYALDIFGIETYENLDLIRSIRNAFAHCKLSVSFETPEIAAICHLLKIPNLIFSLSVPVPVPIKVSTTRAHFQRVCDVTMVNLLFQATVGHSVIDLTKMKISSVDEGLEVLVRRKSLP